MLRTRTIGSHEVYKNTIKTSGMRLGPYYVCSKCGKDNSDLAPNYWEEETCREYLQKQHELVSIPSTNPVRQSKFRNLSFEELFNGCGDPLEYLARRAVTIDTSHGTTPNTW